MSRPIRLDADVGKLRNVLGVSADELPDNPTREQINAAFSGGPRARAHTSRPPDAAIPPNTMDANDREAIITAAVAAGKFTQDRVPHYRTLLERDPYGTQALIEQMSAVSVLPDSVEKVLAAAPEHLQDNLRAHAHEQMLEYEGHYPQQWLPEVHAGRGPVTYGND